MTTPSATARPPPDDLFNQPSADITLRASDQVDLHVHAPILSQASPVFSSMFSLPQPHEAAGDIASHRPVIDVVEDSKTLQTLLRLCYPVDKDPLTEFDHIAAVLKAAMKYEMDWPVRLLERDLAAIVSQNPLKTWAVAALCGREELAGKAAREIATRAPPASATLDVLSTMLEEDKHDSLQGVSAADYFRLRQYLRCWGVPQAYPPVPTIFLQPYQCEPVSTTNRPDGPFVPRIPFPDLYVRARASGDINHGVHGVVLALQSPALAGQVETINAQRAGSRSSTNGHLDLPVLELDIDNTALYDLLDVCYGGAERLPHAPSRLAPLIVAAEKLGMTQVRALADVAWQTAASGNALEAYFVAVQHKLESYAATAARKVLEKPLERGWYTSAMESSPAMAYQRLLDYYQACGRRVNEELCRVAEHCRTQVAQEPANVRNRGKSTTAAVYDRERITNYLQEVGRKTTTEGPVAGRDDELSLTALLRRTCLGAGQSSYDSMWPTSYSDYSHNLLNTMLDTGATLQSSLHGVIAKVTLEIAS